MLSQAISDTNLEHELQKSFPNTRFYQRLPLVNAPDNSVRVSPHFRNPYLLKRQLLDAYMLPEYAKIPCNGRVSLFTWVMAGGLGDLIAQKEIAALLLHHYPDLTITLHTLIHKAHQTAATSSHHVHTFENGEAMDLSLISSSLPHMQKSDLIFQTPTYFPDTPRLLSKCPKPAYEQLGEYGFVHSSAFHPESGARCMGLHFLEKGILIKNRTQKKFEDLKNPIFKELLNPSSFHLAYLVTKRGTLRYLSALFRASQNKDIDIVTTDLSLIIENDFSEAKKCGFKEIQIYIEEGVHTIHLQERGKTARFLIPPTLSHDDFSILMKYSNEPVACRGDQSFSEAISYGKSFFYDPLPHAFPFLQDLAAIGDARLMHRIDACKYLHLLLTDKPIEFSAELHLGLCELCMVLEKDFSINLLLPGIVSRAILFTKRADLVAKEKKIIDEFCTGSLPLQKLIEKMRKLIEGET